MDSTNLVRRIQALAAIAGHNPAVLSAAGVEVTVEVATAGKLTTNDFILVRPLPPHALLHTPGVIQ